MLKVTPHCNFARQKLEPQGVWEGKVWIGMDW
jgi:hypothetical protein